MFVYVITNKVTGKVYIGQHKGANLRQYLQKKFYYARHQKTGSSHLFNAMRKYTDPEQWSIEPLMECETKEQLDRMETLLIALYDTRNPEVGYNICRGGEGFTGPFTEAHRAKLSAGIQKAWDNDSQRKQAMSARLSGVPRPDSVRAQIAESHKGKTVSLETRNKIRLARLAQPDPRLGKRHSEETKKKISAAKKGTPSAFKGRHHTAESNEKNRQAHIKMKLSTLITEVQSELLTQNL